ncbi:MAG: hypothetical protein OCD76_15745 [Reichenbachiella sp.]
MDTRDAWALWSTNMNKIITLFSILIFASCSDLISNRDDKSLAVIVENRIATLENNFRYYVLSNSNKILDYKSFISRIDELRQSKELEELNSEVAVWSDSLNIYLPKVSKEMLNKELDIVKILILDELIIRTLSSSINFSELEPVVFLEKENDSTAFFNVALHARDSLFLPEVLLELPTGTFNVLVDENTGLGVFSMGKKHKHEKKSFRGKVIYFSDKNTQQTKPFEYSPN